MPINMLTVKMADVYVASSTLNNNNTRKQMARRGASKAIVDAGLGLFASRDFKAKEHILDYRYKDGLSGDRVDWLTKLQHDKRYPNTDRPGTHVLKSGKFYYDTAQSGGFGGRANTNPGNQNARFKGSQLHATKAIKKHQEIFAPYSYTSSYKFTHTPKQKFNLFYQPGSRHTLGSGLVAYSFTIPLRN